MAESLTKTDRAGIDTPHIADDVSVRYWFALYAVFFASLGVPLGMIVAGQGWNWSDWTGDLSRTFAATPTAVKLLGFTLYISLCCTFLPLPTGWIVAGKGRVLA